MCLGVVSGCACVCGVGLDETRRGWVVDSFCIAAAVCMSVSFGVFRVFRRLRVHIHIHTRSLFVFLKMMNS